MSQKTIPRPGGRSARVQAAVHQASAALIEEIGRDALTVPLIAARAGVTPSTIYRRWGDLAELLADLALGRMRADAPPLDTGSVAGDLHAWAEQYMEEMASQVGLSMMRDVVAASAGGANCQCAALVAGQIELIVGRAAARGEAAPAVEAVMDGVVAPIIYRALFGPRAPTHEQVDALVERCIKSARAETPARTASPPPR
ncbi:MAG: TetR family transcriptional regulator [Massilia sp.]|nr:TetR family transcriptional regulator [Massilia sp.]